MECVRVNERASKRTYVRIRRRETRLFRSRNTVIRARNAARDREIRRIVTTIPYIRANARNYTFAHENANGRRRKSVHRDRFDCDRARRIDVEKIRVIIIISSIVTYCYFFSREFAKYKNARNARYITRIVSFLSRVKKKAVEFRQNREM